MVSVLVLSWNHEKYIEQCLNSVINQSYRDIEIIYLDNNSSDSSFSIAKKVLEKGGVKYEVCRAAACFGIAHNINTLFAKSHGEYVCLISADDWLLKNNIEEKVNAFQLNLSAGVVSSTGFKFYDEAGVYELIPKQIMKKEDVLTELLVQNFISAPGSLIKGEAVKTVGGWDENLLLEDGDMWIRIAQKYEIEILEQPLFVYRVHENGISSDPEFMYKGKMELYEKYKHLNKNGNLTLRNINDNYLANKVMISAPFITTGKVLKDFRFNKRFAIILIKSLLPVRWKKWYFSTSHKRRNKQVDNPAFNVM